MTPVAALCTTTRYGPCEASSSIDRRLRDLAADEHRLGAGRAQLLGRLLGGGVVPHVAEHGASLRRRATRRSAIARPIPRVPPVTRTDEPRAHRRGSGSSAGAELGSSFQPGRDRGSRPPSSAFDEA